MSDDLDDGFKKFVVEYTFGNSQWILLIDARNWEEAEERMRRIGAYGRIKGEHVATIPAIGGPFVKLVVWFQNTFARKP